MKMICDLAASHIIISYPDLIVLVFAYLNYEYCIEHEIFLIMKYYLDRPEIG